MNKQEKYRGRQKGGINAASEEGPGTTSGAGGASVIREAGTAPKEKEDLRGQREKEARGGRSGGCEQKQAGTERECSGTQVGGLHWGEGRMQGRGRA